MINQLNRLAQAWGCKCTSDYVDEALDAICDDMPFGVTTEIAEIISAELTADMSPYITTPFELVIGQEYELTVNGVVYKSDCIGLEEDGVVLPTIGNLGMVDEIYTDIGCPLLLMYMPPEIQSDGVYGMWQSLFTEADFPVTVTVKGVKETIKKIDVKYLPIEELKKALGIG